MSDYIKSIEQQNEELKRLYAESERRLEFVNRVSCMRLPYHYRIYFEADEGEDFTFVYPRQATLILYKELLKFDGKSINKLRKYLSCIPICTKHAPYITLIQLSMWIGKDVHNPSTFNMHMRGCVFEKDNDTNIVHKRLVIRTDYSYRKWAL